MSNMLNMTNLTKFLLIFAVGIGFGVGLFVLAQEGTGTPTTEATTIEATTTPEETAAETAQDIALDQEVSAQDLGVSEPRLLPDSPFYFAKNWWRGLRLAFTFNPLKKAELQERFANEKLLELKKLAERKKNPKILERAVKNYQKEIERVKTRAEALKARVKNKARLEPFLDKFIRHQVLHQRVLEKLETKVPPQAIEKIKQARERHLERFGDVMLKLEDKDKIPERLEKSLEKIKGSKFRAIKHLELLKRLEEKAPEDKKEAIQKAEERMLQKFKARMEKMPPQEQERFENYLEKIRGDKEKHLEILENLRSEIKERPELKKRLEASRIRVLKRIKEKAQEKNCPEWSPPSPGFCKEGRVIIKRDEKGCPLPPQCIVPGETGISPKPLPGQAGKPEVACIHLWDPVCGKDGKTYSNACFAKAAGVEIKHKGVCKEKVTCVEEGEILDLGINLDLKCCAGLVRKSLYDLENCIALPGLKFICIKCGNGICGPGENKCNCPEDCK